MDHGVYDSVPVRHYVFGAAAVLLMVAVPAILKVGVVASTFQVAFALVKG